MESIVSIIPVLILTYIGIGVLFSIYFFIKGAAQLDPLILDSKWTVKLLLVPGAIGLWPFLLVKLITSKKS